MLPYLSHRDIAHHYDRNVAHLRLVLIISDWLSIT
jgi:hypothetical protein